MNPRRILCVHAGPELEKLRGVLEQEGYEVLPVADGGEALDVLSSETVDGVVLDSNLSTPGGCALRNRIQHAHPETPMLLFRDVAEVTQLPLRVLRVYLSDPKSREAALAQCYN